MERTFFISFCRTNNLLAVLNDPAFPVGLRPLIPFIDETFPRTFKHTSSDASSASTEPTQVTGTTSALSQDTYAALLHHLLSEPHLSDYTYYRPIGSPTDPNIPILNPNAQLLPFVAVSRRRFADARHSSGDSNILFRSRGLRRATCEAVGQIQSIFKHKRTIKNGGFRHQIFFAIKAYQSLSPIDAHLDPYQVFEGLGARLVYTALNPHTVVVPLSDVVCHVALCPFESPPSVQQPSSQCAVVLVLDEYQERVMNADLCGWRVSLGPSGRHGSWAPERYCARWRQTGGAVCT
ncbi:hypothetical protein LXA43DRAFT_977421 [Ganoderma leucocontextum]|nr:hypothetical protein LXA43DRAFT_977421 [Ganoderma leucocontextum]